MNKIFEEEQRILAEALHKIQILSRDIEINELIQDRKYLEVLERMTQVALACRKIAIVMGSLEFRRLNESKSKTIGGNEMKHKEDETSSPGKVP